ncbi:hypothetical protein DY218_27170 [Streptomyces triticagri]|uniref:Uncharacterized protein n=1 Tax=Streptomyces triticagri TaxID=2293568 RepID=A0A372LY58_9ACTN|nr:hypothetical protein [Streptomyces triticagri]RFU83592.1 hypothetical protein DY218_27170 [Streptomyces triticagri]
MAQRMAVAAGSDTDQLLRCLLNINAHHDSDRMLLPVTAYVLDWEALETIPSGGMVTGRLHPSAEQLTDLAQLDAHTSHTVPTSLELAENTAYADRKNGRVGAALVLEIDDGALVGLGEGPARQVFAVDYGGTVATLLKPSSGEMSWFIQPPAEPGYGDPPAGVDYLSIGSQVLSLALSYVHQDVND